MDEFNNENNQQNEQGQQDVFNPEVTPAPEVNYGQVNTGAPSDDGKGMAIASMVLGIISIVLSCCFYYIAMPCAIISLILGAVSLKKSPNNKGMATAGIVLSIITLIVAVVTIILLVAGVSTGILSEIMGNM